jgi:hypothetical protein
MGLLMAGTGSVILNVIFTPGVSRATSGVRDEHLRRHSKTMITACAGGDAHGGLADGSSHDSYHTCGYN